MLTSRRVTCQGLTGIYLSATNRELAAHVGAGESRSLWRVTSGGCAGRGEMQPSAIAANAEGHTPNASQLSVSGARCPGKAHEAR